MCLVVGTATNSNRFDIETFIANPKADTYTVRVVPRDAASARFRLRAKAEGTVNPPLDVLGYHPVSCTADEAVESGAKRCLRLPRRPGASTFGLSVGWGDVYRWQRPGQYVEFAGNGDGLYVVRAAVDRKEILGLQQEFPPYRRTLSV